MSRKAKAAEFVNESYDITVTGRHVLITDAMKNYAIEKISRIDRLTDRILEVIVTMDIQKIEQHVDILLKVDHFKIRSSASSNDMYVSIDMAVDKLEKQLLRYKDKMLDERQRGRSLGVVDMNVNVLKPARDNDLVEINEDIEYENSRELVEKYSPHRIVAREVHSLKMFSYDEAILHMDLSGDAFLIFKTMENELKVIYRRTDGNYGIIEPENVSGR